MSWKCKGDLPDERAPMTGARFVAFAACFALVYWIGAQAGLYLKASFGDVTPIWPPSGLAVVLFIVWGVRFWPVIALGEFAAALSINQPPLAGVIGGCAQIIEAMLACRLLRLAGVHDITASAQSVIRFTVFGVMLPPLAAALLGAISLLNVGTLAPADFMSGILTWWMGDAIGILVLTPLLTRIARERRIPLDRASLPLFISFLLMMVLIGLGITYGLAARGPYLFFLLLPMLVVAALRFGLSGASAAAVALTIIVYGLRPHDADHGDFLTAVRMLFVGISAFTAYLVAGFMKERAASAARLRDMEIAMQQTDKMRALGTLAGGVAHDFNNLIGIIRGHAELALMYQAGAGDARDEYLRQIRTACDHAADLARRILTFSRDGEGTAEILDVARSVENMAKLFKSAMPANAELHLALNAEQTHVRCAEAQLHQIVMNLLTNAAHSTPGKRGRIELRLTNRRIADASSAPPQARPGDYLVIEVADNGNGIPPEIQSRIFEPYFTTKAHGRGTGLGLFIVQAIVRDLSGFIEFESAVGQGTTMRVHLPIADQPK